MCLALSALFGLDGRYTLCGIDIHFDSQGEGINVFGETCFSKIATCLLRNPIVKLASFGYLHVFIHEMGHAIAAKLCGNCTPHVTIFTNTCRGEASSLGARNLFVSLAGPILGTLWEIAKLIVATALIIFLPPIGIPLGIFLGAGAAFWLFGEVAYACSRNGDWNFLR